MEIVCKNISYISNNKKILDNINLNITEGINSIIGENNSGKSLLLKIISGRIIPSSGSITIGEKDEFDVQSKVGFISDYLERQDNDKTVFDEIGTYIEKFNYKLDNKDKRIKDSLKMVGLDSSYLNRKLSDLSFGELKLVSIASVLGYNPKILIFDEPTLGLDYKGKCNLIKIIRLLKNRFNKVIIFTSNDMDLVHKLSDNIFVLSKGKIVMSGSKYEIFTNDEIINKYHLDIPKVVNFSKLVLLKKNKKIGYRDEINDLLKDIYRYGKW